MTYRPVSRPPRRRGCLRGCAGCLFHHPLTVGLTFVALVLWLNQLVRAAIALAAGQPPDLLAVALTTVLLILAQLGPRLAPHLWRRWHTAHPATEFRTPFSTGAIDRDVWQGGIWARRRMPIPLSAMQQDDAPPLSSTQPDGLPTIPRFDEAMIIGRIGSGRSVRGTELIQAWLDAGGQPICIDPEPPTPHSPEDPTDE